MSLFNDNTQNDHIGHVKYQTGGRGVPGRDGVGFKLDSDGNYDMDQKIIRNMKVPNDVPEVGDYDSYVKDLKTGINKQYVNDHS